MTDPLPPILQSPTPIMPNFGTRAAKVSWLAPLASLLVFATALLCNPPVILCGGVGGVLWTTGLASGIVALSSMRRYGRKGIRRPAIIGLSLTLAVLLLLLVVGLVVILFWGSLQILKRPWGNFI